jgi:hypothetical protein
MNIQDIPQEKSNISILIKKQENMSTKVPIRNNNKILEQEAQRLQVGKMYVFFVGNYYEVVGLFLGRNQNGSSKILCLLNTCGITDGTIINKTCDIAFEYFYWRSLARKYHGHKND